MNNLTRLVLTATLLAVSSMSVAQSEPDESADELKIAALEALMAAPAEKAMPLVNKVLAGKNSDDVKERALFILSQIDTPEAQATLLRFARDEQGSLQAEAIRMIGIGGDEAALAELDAIYAAGDREARDAVLEAYLIAGDKRAVFEIAANADNSDDFEEAVDILGAMGASDELRELRSRTGVSETLIDAYAVSGDLESLRAVARDGSDVEMQAEAIEALGGLDGLNLATSNASGDFDRIRRPENILAEGVHLPRFRHAVCSHIEPLSHSLAAWHPDLPRRL